MLQNDFLMRAIQRLAQAFGELVAGKGSQNPQASILEIENLLSESLNTRRQFLFDELAGKDDVEPRLAVEYGRLLALHASLANRMGDQTLAAVSASLAARFLQLGLVDLVTESTIEAERSLVELLRSAAGQLLSDNEVLSALKRLFRYAASTNRSAKAEDYLFMVIDRGADEAFQKEGIEAFNGLRDRIVAGVPAGNDEEHLSLDEVDAVLRELNESL